MARRSTTLIGDAIGRMKRQDLLDQFWANEIPIAPVRHAHEALEDEQVINNGMSVEVDDPVHGPVRQAGISFRVARGADARGAGSATRGRPAHRRGARRARRASRHARASARPAKRSVTHALEGIKILDLGNFLAGPFGPMLLGDLGATVYKLESPQGDQMRPVTQPFNGCQRGKLDVVVDLKQPEGVGDRAPADPRGRRRAPQHAAGRGRATGRRLRDRQAAQPDRHLLPHDDVGQRRPRATWPGFDQLAQSSCGLEQELGGEGNGPNWYRFGMCDQACAVQSALAVLMALYWRERTGEGQLVDTSIVNGGVQLNTDAWIGPDGWSERPRTDAQQTGFGPLYRLYETSDGWLALACLGETHRRALASVVPALDAAHAGGVLRRAHTRRSRSTCSTARACRWSWRPRTPAAPGSRSPTSWPRASSPTTSTRRTGASASSATSCTCRTRRAASPARRRCSASTRARCSPTSATPTPRSQTLRDQGVTLWPD